MGRPVEFVDGRYDKAKENLEEHPKWGIAKYIGRRIAEGTGWVVLGFGTVVAVAPEVGETVVQAVRNTGDALDNIEDYMTGIGEAIFNNNGNNNESEPTPSPTTTFMPEGSTPTPEATIGATEAPTSPAEADSSNGLPPVVEAPEEL